MPIGPRGERLPYNGNGNPDLPPMGGGDLMAAQEFEASRGGDVDSLMSELIQITQRAEQIISQLESQGVNPEQLLAGGGPVGGMPQMPVAANTGPPMPGLIA